ncbi:MAG: hypothetical protein WB992_26215 [Bryobacteraceae bacterium]
MRRALLLCLGLIAFTWLEFEFFPGHTYLEGGSQLYLPVLERLDTPGYLSRDLVATHPHVTYTIYDELTIFLHEAGRLNFETAVKAQQAVCRGAGILGVFLLVLSAGLSDIPAFVIAVLLNLGAVLTGPAAELVEHEPVPRAFAFALVILAMGLMAREKPLLGGLAGGLAVIYHPATAAPFWVLMIAAFVFDRRLRPLLRPALIILLVFCLLLANLTQLQPGVADPQPFFGQLSPRLAQLQQYRTKYVWVSLWAGKEIWHYLAIWVSGVWATARIWKTLNRPMRWFLAALPAYGILSVPLSYVLLERLRWSLVSEVQPAQALLFTVALASVACGVAGMRAAAARRNWEACLWFLPVFALPIDVDVLNLLRLADRVNFLQAALCVALACGLAYLVRRFGATRWKALILLAPLTAIFVIPTIGRVEHQRKIDATPIRELADWAEQSTWGSSMFLFPDAGRELYPGMFRAESRRALWVDWESGDLVDYFESAGAEWWNRWRQTMDGPYSPDRLPNALSFPIDYCVLKRRNQLAGIKPVFANSDFVVYDARHLREASVPLRNASLTPKS